MTSASSSPPRPPLGAPLLGEDEKEAEGAEAAAEGCGERGGGGGTSPHSSSVALRAEFSELLHFSWPVGISSLLRVAMYSTDTSFLGHMRVDPTAKLTASSLGSAWTNALMVVVFGFAYALNALCAQAIGAGNPKLAGNWLQLSLALCTLLSVPAVVGNLFTSDVLQLFTSKESVLEYAQTFNLWASLGILPTVLYMAVRQYCQAMKVVRPAMIVSLVAVGLNVGVNQLLVFGDGADFSGFGLIGSPLATSISLTFQVGRKDVRVVRLRETYDEEVRVLTY